MITKLPVRRISRGDLQFTVKSILHSTKLLLLLLVVMPLTACLSGAAYQVYEGEPRPALQIASVAGAQFLRQDWLNRYVDAVRFTRIDDITIDDSVAYSRIEIEPGFHDVTVYFYWDMGSARGLAPALVSYAATRESLSRTLRFNALAGETYQVMAEPHFNAERRDITTLTHVDFWVLDSEGNEIVSRAEGRFIPDSD